MRTKYIYPLFVILLLIGFKITSLSQTIQSDIQSLSKEADVKKRKVSTNVDFLGPRATAS